MILLGNALLFYEYSEVMAELEEGSVEEYRERMRGRVEEERKGVWLEGVWEIEWER